MSFSFLSLLVLVQLLDRILVRCVENIGTHHALPSKLFNVQIVSSSCVGSLMDEKKPLKIYETLMRVAALSYSYVQTELSGLPASAACSLASWPKR